MSQDPYSGYNPNPANPGGSQSSQNPYGTPSQNPYGTPPQNPYETPSQNPYGTPPQNPYETPSQNPYDVPPYQVPPQPPQGAYQEFPPYATMPPPNAYSVPGYNPHQESYAFQSSSPLPLGAAISQLPQQYFRVLTKPSQFTFALEMGKASWGIVWVQLIAYAIIVGIIVYIQTSISLVSINGMMSEYNIRSDVLQTMPQMASIGSIILVPVFFFIAQGITYLLAKAFGGSGTFLRQCYTSLLITVPINISSSVLGLIPFLGSLVSFTLSIYAIILQTFSLMSVHRISGGKATAVVLISLAIVIVLVIVLAVVFVMAIISAMPHSPYSP